MTGLFEVTAPEPMSKFEGAWKQHEQNKEAVEIHRQHGDVRKILSTGQLKKYKKLLAELERDLESHGVNDLLQQETALDDEWNDLRAQKYRLEKKIETTEYHDEINALKAQLRIVFRNAHSIKADRDAIKDKLTQYRKWIIRARRIRARIDEHEAGVKDEEINKRKRQMMDREANTIAEVVVRTLNGMDFCFRTTHKGKERVISVDFARLVVTPDTVQLKLKAGQRGLFGGYKHFIPRGVKLSSVLSDEMVLAQISASIEMPVTCPQSETGRWSEGFWLYIQRNGLRDGLPEHVQFSEYIKRYPNENRHLLPFPTGLKEGMWASWQYLTKTPHVIVTGQTGSGKTNTMLSMICTWITNHSPAEIQFVMVDLKEGADLYGFNGIPHLIGDVITDIDTVAHVIVRLEDIRKKRMEEFRRSGVRNISAFNAIHPEYAMPHIAIVFDEFGALQSGAYKSQAKIIFNVCSQMAMKARAAGMHLIIGAQTPRKEHIPPDVRDNIVFRMTGRQVTLGGSLAATGSAAANKLDRVAGRFWCEDGLDTYPVQMPEILDSQVQDAIERAKVYERVQTVDIMPKADGESVVMTAATVKRPFTHEEFVSIVIDNLGGSINYTDVYNIAKESYDVSQSKARKIADMVKQMESIEYDGKCYEVQTAVGRGARKLVEVGIIE